MNHAALNVELFTTYTQWTTQLPLGFKEKAYFEAPSAISGQAL
jgi:hypothetical protein